MNIFYKYIGDDSRAYHMQTIKMFPVPRKKSITRQLLNRSESNGRLLNICLIDSRTLLSKQRYINKTV